MTTIIGNINNIAPNTKITKTMSPKYEIFDTRAIVEKIMSDLGLDCTIKIKGNNPNRVSTKHFVEIALNETFDLPDGKYSPRIIIGNSYAGESSLNVRIGLFRFVCENGLIIGSSTYCKRIRHYGKSSREHVESLTLAIKDAIDKAKDLAWYQYTTMQGKLSYLEAQRKVESLDLSKSVKEKVLATFECPNREADEGQTVYTLYNIVNEIMRQRGRSEMRQVEKKQQSC
jgi:hypothetical protein